MQRKIRHIITSIVVLQFVLYCFIPHISLASEDAQVDAIKYRIKGYMYQRKGRFQEAMRMYAKAVEADPFYACAHNDLGVLYEQKGLLKKAEEQYLEALRIDPAYTAVYTNLALLYERQGETGKAHAYWARRVEAGDPYDPWTIKAAQRRDELGLMAQREMEPEVEAIEEEPEIEVVEEKVVLPEPVSKEEAAAISAKRIAREMAAKKLELKKGKVAQAQGKFKEGLGFYKKRNYEAAMVAFHGALEFDPAHKRANEHVQKCRAKIEEARQKKQRKIDVIFKKAQTYYLEKQYDRATAEFEKIVEIDPNYPGIHNTIQEVQQEKIRVATEKQERIKQAQLNKEQARLEAKKKKEAERLRRQQARLEEQKRKEQERAAAQRQVELRREQERVAKAKQEEIQRLQLEQERLKRQEEKLRLEQERIASQVERALEKAEDYSKNKRFDLTIKEYEKVKQLDPSFQGIDNLIKQTRKDAEHFAEERRQQKTLKEVEKKYNLADKLYRDKKYEQARTELEALLKLDPYHPDAKRLLRYCNHRIMQKKYDVEPTDTKASSTAYSAIAKQPTRAESYPPLKEGIELITSGTDRNYEILGIVAHKAQEKDTDIINKKLLEKGKLKGADHIIQIRYFDHKDYVYGYGTAVKLKR